MLVTMQSYARAPGFSAGPGDTIEVPDELGSLLVGAPDAPEAECLAIDASISESERALRMKPAEETTGPEDTDLEADHEAPLEPAPADEAPHDSEN